MPHRGRQTATCLQEGGALDRLHATDAFMSEPRLLNGRRTLRGMTAVEAGENGVSRRQKVPEEVAGSKGPYLAGGEGLCHRVADAVFLGDRPPAGLGSVDIGRHEAHAAAPVRLANP